MAIQTISSGRVYVSDEIKCIKALFAKLNVSTRADAVAIALRKHLLKI